MGATPRLDAGQWDRFVAEYWNKQPVCLTDVFAAPLLDDADILAVLRRGGARMKTVPAGALPGSDVRDLFYFAGDDPAFAVETVDPFPLAEDRDLASYYARVKARLGGQDYCLLVQDVQAHPVLWERALAFLRPLHDRVGQPPYVSRCECFLGTYAASPVGVHLDASHVFTFVLTGRKRFRAWPGDYPRQAPDLPGSVKYDHYLADAYTLEAGPCDLVYWPPSFWHVAENFTFSATITMLWEEWNLRLPKDPCVHGWLANVVAERTRDVSPERSTAAPRLPAPLQEARDRFVAAQQGPGFEDAVWTAWLARASKLAFNGPAMLAAVELRDGDRLVANEPVPLEWTRLASGRLLCAANGESFEVGPAVAPVLDRIVRRQAWTVGELAREFPGVPAIRELVETCLRLRAVIAAEAS